jgi:hypothetical protein
MVSRSLYKLASAAMLIAACAASAGCSHLIAQAKSRSQFVATAASPSVRYLPGSQVLADRIAASLEHSMKFVEQFHGATFAHQPQVFVCKTACMAAFAPGSKNDPATQLGDSIFINEDLILQREIQRGIPADGFLVHELAHLLLYQRAGVIAYLRVPAWFKEGVAVVASDGAGVSATPAEAARSILGGKFFDAAEPGSMFRNRTAPSYGLPVSIFYRESTLFVQYLKDQNPTAFRLALNSILKGDDFQESFRRAYGRSIASYWPDFVTTMPRIAAR